jgi:hypothetical protein
VAVKAANSSGTFWLRSDMAERLNEVKSIGLDLAKAQRQELQHIESHPRYACDVPRHRNNAIL